MHVCDIFSKCVSHNLGSIERETKCICIAFLIDIGYYV